MRTAPALVLAIVLLVPAASAAPLVGAGVGPGPEVLTSKEGPYYLFATLSPPEAPRPGEPSHDDCGHDEQRPGKRLPLEFALLSLLADLRAWDPRESGSFSDWFPVCFSGSVKNPLLNTSGYVAYHFPTGRYYVEIESGDGGTSVPLPLDPSSILGFGFALQPAKAERSVSQTGTTGVGIEADCATCPPPP